MLVLRNSQEIYKEEDSHEEQYKNLSHVSKYNKISHRFSKKMWFGH